MESTRALNRDTSAVSLYSRPRIAKECHLATVVLPRVGKICHISVRHIGMK